MALCLQWCLRRRWTTTQFKPYNVSLLDDMVVKLDTANMGEEAVIVKNGNRICGTGGALTNTSVEQSKVYFEAKVQSSGKWGVGLATYNVDLNTVPMGRDTETWVMRQDGTLWHKNQQRGKLADPPEEGDVVGVSFDHVEARFYLNGKPTDCVFYGIRGTVSPVVYVDDGAVLDMEFKSFYYHPPQGFSQLLMEQYFSDGSISDEFIDLQQNTKSEFVNVSLRPLPDKEKTYGSEEKEFLMVNHQENE